MSKLILVEFNNQRILTSQQLSEVYGVEPVRIRQAFNRNESRFVEGKHFYKLEGEELRKFKTEYLNDTSLKINSLMLWTEKGAARHAKILDTDEAWEVFEELEDTYFRVKENTENFTKNLSKELKAIFMLDEKTNILESEVKDIKENSPLFSIECEELQKALKKKGIELLGGKQSKAYQDKSLRTKLYSDIQREIKRQFGLESSYKALKRKELNKALEIINNYVPPIVIAEEIKTLNNQVHFEKVI